MNRDILLTSIYAADVKWKLYMEAEDRDEPEEETDKLYLDYHNTVGIPASTKSITYMVQGID